MSSRTTTGSPASHASPDDSRPPTTDAVVLRTRTSTDAPPLVSVVHPSGSAVVSHSATVEPSTEPTRSTPVAISGATRVSTRTAAASAAPVASTARTDMTMIFFIFPLLSLKFYAAIRLGTCFPYWFMV